MFVSRRISDASYISISRAKEENFCDFKMRTEKQLFLNKIFCSSFYEGIKTTEKVLTQ